MPQVDRFIDTKTAANWCQCTQAAIRSACHRGNLTNYGTYYQAAWDIQEVAKWATARAARKAKRQDKPAA
jgi:hypothetical protein